MKRVKNILWMITRGFGLWKVDDDDADAEDDGIQRIPGVCTTNEIETSSWDSDGGMNESSERVSIPVYVNRSVVPLLLRWLALVVRAHP